MCQTADRGAGSVHDHAAPNGHIQHPYPCANAHAHLRRRVPTNFARSNQSDIRYWPPTPGVCRHQSKRGGTMLHPRRFAQYVGAIARLRSGIVRQMSRHPAAVPVQQSASIRHIGKSPTKHFRLCRASPPGSCHRSSLRSRSAAGHVRQMLGYAGWRVHNAGTNWPIRRSIRADRNRNHPRD